MTKRHDEDKLQLKYNRLYVLYVQQTYSFVSNIPASVLVTVSTIQETQEF